MPNLELSLYGTQYDTANIVYHAVHTMHCILLHTMYYHTLHSTQCDVHCVSSRRLAVGFVYSERRELKTSK